MTLPVMPEVASFILKTKILARNPTITIEDFAKSARALIEHKKSGANGKFLTQGAFFFLSRERGGVHGSILLMPGQKFIGDWRGLDKADARPVIVPETDYPGVLRSELPDFFAAQATILYRHEKRRPKLGPDITSLTKPLQPLTIPNSKELHGEVREAIIEKQATMHKVHRETALRYLKRIVGPANRNKVMNIGFNVEQGLKHHSRNKGVNFHDATGLVLETDLITQLLLDCKPAVSEPNIEIARETEQTMREAGYSTLLCSASSTQLILYLSPGASHNRGKVYSELISIASAIPQGQRGHKGISYRNLTLSGSSKSRGVSVNRHSFEPIKTIPQVILPLSLFILPPEPKTTTTRALEGSHAIREENASGKAIVPLVNDHEMDYDSHPSVVAYRFGDIAPKVLQFLQAAGVARRNDDISEVNVPVPDSDLDTIFREWRKKPTPTTEQFDLDDVEVTYAVPQGRQVLIRVGGFRYGAEPPKLVGKYAESFRQGGRPAELAGFSDGSVRTGLPQTEDLAFIHRPLPGATEVTYFGTLAANSGIPSDMPKRLMTQDSMDWPSCTLYIEGVLGEKDVAESFRRIAILATPTVKPVRFARKSVLQVHEDEMINGAADRLGIVQRKDGVWSRKHYLRRNRAALLILAMDTAGKRPRNNEVGTLLLGVMSNEKRPVKYHDKEGGVSTKYRWAIVYETVAKVATFEGFSVSDRRALFQHLASKGTHLKDDWLFVEPQEADAVLEVEWRTAQIRSRPRYVLERMYDTLEREAKTGFDETGVLSPRPFPGEKTTPSDPSYERMQFGRKPDQQEVGTPQLLQIEDADLPQLTDAKIVGIMSVIPGLGPLAWEHAAAGALLSSKAEFTTSEGRTFSTVITLDQFTTNPPNPYPNFSAHRQELPWKFDQDVFDGTTFRTLKLDDPNSRRKTYGMLNRNTRYEKYRGVNAIVGKIGGKWAVQTYRVPKKYKVRRTVKEVWRDKRPPPKWYKDRHPGSKPYGTNPQPPPPPPLTPPPPPPRRGKRKPPKDKPRQPWQPKTDDFPPRKKSKWSPEQRKKFEEKRKRRWGTLQSRPIPFEDAKARFLGPGTRPWASGMSSARLQRIANAANEAIAVWWLPSKMDPGLSMESIGKVVALGTVHYGPLDVVEGRAEAWSLYRAGRSGPPSSADSPIPLPGEEEYIITIVHPLPPGLVPGTGRADVELEEGVSRQGPISSERDVTDWQQLLEENPLVAIEETVPQNSIIVICGPSGSGKSSLARAVRATIGKSAKIVPSYMTRSKRPKEVEGKDGYFITEKKFLKMIANREFTAPNGVDLWFRQANNKLYGRRYEDLSKPKIVIIDALFRGLEAMREGFEHVYGVFIKTQLPRHELRRIIKSRGGMTDKEVDSRLNVSFGMLHSYRNYNFDLVIANKKGQLKKNARFVAARFFDQQAMLVPSAHPHAPLLGRAGHRTNPPSSPPATMEMGFQHRGRTKHHNKPYKGKQSDIPREADKWKSRTFRSEGTYEHWANHLNENETPYVVSLKIDGDSALAHFDGKETVIWNKRGRWRTNFHITDEITKILKKKKVKSVKLMGELYAVGDDGLMLPLSGGGSDSVGSIIVAPKTMERQQKIRFAAFDILEMNGKSMGEMEYKDRIAVTAGLVGGGDTVRAVPLKTGKGTTALNQMWKEGMLEPEFEGLVLRFDQDTKSYKIKGMGTVDLAIIGFFRGGSAQFTDEEGVIRRAGHAGGKSNMIGGVAAAYMDKNGDWVYQGNIGTGWKHAEATALLEELSKHAFPPSSYPVKPPTLSGVKWGSHIVLPGKTHDHLGKGAMIPVKPTLIGEFQYRSLGWGEKPVYRIKGNKIFQVGTRRAPTAQQGSFKRWRDDKEMTPQDLRLSQVPAEGTGKWGQMEENPPDEYLLKPDFTPPEGYRTEARAGKMNRHTASWYSMPSRHTLRPIDSGRPAKWARENPIDEIIPMWEKEAGPPTEPFNIRKEAEDFVKADPWLAKCWSVCTDAAYEFARFLRWKHEDNLPKSVEKWKVIWGVYHGERILPADMIDNEWDDPFHVYIKHEDGRIIDLTADQFGTGIKTPYFPNKQERKLYKGMNDREEGVIVGDLYNGRPIDLDRLAASSANTAHDYTKMNPAGVRGPRGVPLWEREYTGFPGAMGAALSLSNQYPKYAWLVLERGHEDNIHVKPWPPFGVRESSSSLPALGDTIEYEGNEYRVQSAYFKGREIPDLNPVRPGSGTALLSKGDKQGRVAFKRGGKGDWWLAAVAYDTAESAKANKRKFADKCRSMLGKKHGLLRVHHNLRYLICTTKGRTLKADQTHPTTGGPDYTADHQQIRSWDEPPTTILTDNMLGIEHRPNPPYESPAQRRRRLRRYTTRFDFVPGKVYSFEELPGHESGRVVTALEEDYGPVGTSLREDALHHFRSKAEGGYGWPGSAEDATYRAVIIPVEDLRKWVNQFGHLTGRPKLQKAIEERGLEYPSIGNEGNNRQIAMAHLGRPMPHLVVTPESYIRRRPKALGPEPGVQHGASIADRESNLEEGPTHLRFGGFRGLRENPPVSVLPGHLRGKNRPALYKYSMLGKDVTKTFAKWPVISVSDDGSQSELHVDSIYTDDFSKYHTRSRGNLVRINMFRRKAGFKVMKGDQELVTQPSYIISVETGGKHYYASNTVSARYAKLAHFPKKKSEPRLRLETRGNLEVAGRRQWEWPEPEHHVIIRGKRHPLYEKMEVWPAEYSYDMVNHPLKGNWPPAARPNPLPRYLITVPHAAKPVGFTKRDRLLRFSRHLSDLEAPNLATKLQVDLEAGGDADVVLLMGDTPRNEVDLNRYESEQTEYEQSFTEALVNIDTMIDVHSYPKSHEKWNHVQVVLLAIDSDQHTILNQQLADFITAETDLRTMVDIATEENYLLHRGLGAGKQAFLVEVLEGSHPSDISRLSEALAKFLKMQSNPPKGMIIHQYTLRIPFLPTDAMLASIALEDKGYPFIKESMRSMSYTHQVPYVTAAVSLNIQQNRPFAYLYSAHKMTEKQQEKVGKVLATILKGQPKPNPSLDGMGISQLRTEFYRLKKEGGEKYQGRLPGDIWNSAPKLRDFLGGESDVETKPEKGKGGKDGKDGKAKGKGGKEPPKTKQPTRVKNLSTTLSKTIMGSLLIRRPPKKKKGKGKGKGKGEQQEKGKGKDKRRKKKPPKGKSKHFSAAEMTAAIANPKQSAYAKEYLDDHKPMSEKKIKTTFKSEKLRGPIGSKELFEQMTEKTQNFGEAFGWVRDGKLYFRAGPRTQNEARIDGKMMKGAEAFFHTHPAAWEPSQTSPDDFKVYHGLFSNLGICHHFTVMGDRIDWFKFAKKDRIPGEEMAEVAKDFEDEVDKVFEKAEGKFLQGTDNEHAHLSARTRHINGQLMKRLPEYRARFKCYILSPKQIQSADSNGRRI
jgi:guanylate kinase